ncbi:hypothetical protein [Candidatus Nitrospira nitrificans]|uniref:Uncharacterized protein n=1 Tax=Candidatus Nitrospira nitrificans TaxID=1742973 RepID=A0A0S4LAY5_9BACT|nr:hypothetical protein [Candidatus Nitrospira nitrificans]CUS34897.1 conserved hypothetical protein [Candidatus Nitrospira nitrificans]
MPVENNFQHDELSRKSPGERLSFADLADAVPPDSPAWAETMSAYGTSLFQAGVAAIVLLHGSLHGTDVFGAQRLDEVGGLKRGYSRGVSGLDALLAAMREDSNGILALPGGLTPPLPDDDATKTILDEQIGDAGNFTGEYVDSLRKAINKKLTQPISCTRLLWSSEHHHLGRALAAVSLLAELHKLCQHQNLGKGHRILIQAHGQAGLTLAFVSNLLCPSPITGRPKLLDTLTGYAAQAGQTTLIDTIKLVESMLATASPLHGVTLDIVTFGTPVRYGWDPSGIGKLLHVVNHRNLRTDGKSWLAKMELPQITMEMPIAWGGDYVQELAVAGSDAVPPTEPAKAANRKVWEMVEPYDGFERWLECARRAVRFPSEGRCLLVDYKDSTGSTNPRDHYYGHAVYTRRRALLFNTTQIIRAFYET